MENLENGAKDDIRREQDWDMCCICSLANHSSHLPKFQLVSKLSHVEENFQESSYRLKPFMPGTF